VKKKDTPEMAEIVDQKILDAATATLRTDVVKPTTRCVICNADSAPNSTESLCWVCRRLKISAWRDSETPINAQE
jgi:hypothetical protein